MNLPANLKPAVPRVGDTVKFPHGTAIYNVVTLNRDRAVIFRNGNRYAPRVNRLVVVPGVGVKVFVKPIPSGKAFVGTATMESDGCLFINNTWVVKSRCVAVEEVSPEPIPPAVPVKEGLYVRELHSVTDTGYSRLQVSR